MEHHEWFREWRVAGDDRDLIEADLACGGAGMAVIAVSIMMVSISIVIFAAVK